MDEFSAQRKKFANPQAPAFYIVTIGIAVPIVTLISYFLRIHEYWGWPVLLVPPIITAILGLVAESISIFTSVDIGENYIILRAPLRKVVVSSNDVDRVELNPPVMTLKMDWGLWTHPSVCVIHRRVSDPNRAAAHKKNPWLVTEYRYSEQPIEIATMPDGLKRRIAQTLDPVHWPPLPEPSQE